ncbi:MAG: hypothetical protein V7709_09370 [Halioglobus sp.]
MMNKLLSAILLLTLSGVSLTALADDHEDDEGAGTDKEKVVLCHKGAKSISVGAPGLNAHMNHGDTEGYCEDAGESGPDDPEGSDDAAVVMMHCEATDGAVLVTSFSSSVVFVDQPLIDIALGTDCAVALAALLNAELRLRSVTGGSGSGTDYLLLGQTGDS